MFISATFMVNCESNTINVETMAYTSGGIFLRDVLKIQFKHRRV